MTSPQSIGEVIDTDADLDWPVPATPGTYVLRYSATGAEGTFSDDVTVTVTDVPTGPQTIYPDSIPSRATVGEPTLTVAPPPGALPTYPNSTTFPGDATWPGYGLPAGPGPQTIYPDSIPSRAIVGQPRLTVDPVPLPQTIYPDSIPSRVRVGAPSLTVGAAPPDQAVTDLTVSLFAIDPELGAVALPDFTAMTVSPQRNSGGSITLEYPPDGENFAVLRSAITGARDVEFEVWTSGTSRGARRGLLQEAQGDDTAESATWTFGGGFDGVRMDHAVILPQDPGPLLPDDDDDPTNDKHANEKRELIFNAATPGTVMATAMTLAHEHEWLVDITWDFTSTHDSEGNPWPQVMSSKFSPGSTYTQILDRLVALGLAEWDVQWTGAHRVLRMWVPEGRGQDLTVLPVPVVLRHGQNILDAPRKWSVREAGTDVLVAGSEGYYAVASDPDAVARRGRKIATFVSANNLADQDAVTAHALNQLPVVTSGLHEITHGIGMLPGTPRPIETYDIGDWVFSESSGVLERVRVVQYTMTVDKQQGLSGTTTLNDTHTDWLTRLKARLDAIEAGETVVGTSEPGPNLSDITPPAAPEGLTAESIAYTDPAHTNPLASVTVGWLPVVTNADGSNYPTVNAARFILLKMEEIENNPPDDPDDSVIDQDTWTWEECPRVVTDYAPQLRQEYAADGSPPGVETWLQNYVAEFSATPTATDDVAGYRVRYAYVGLEQTGGLPSSDPFPDAERFYYEATPSTGTTSTSWTFGGVEGAANIRIEVAAFDRSGNQGLWATIGHDTAADDTPPPRSSAPTGAKPWFRTIDVPWDGLDQFGVPMLISAVDFDHTEVWIGQPAAFTNVPPDRATDAVPFDPTNPDPQHVGNLFAAGTHNIPDIPHGVGFYAGLRPVDRAGNPGEMSALVGPIYAEQLFSDDLRDQIINDSSMIAAQTVGTLQVVDGAIINAKIADLAVNSAKISDLEVGKLRSGTMTAQVTVSGKFRTNASDAADRVEIDPAGIRLYAGPTVIGNWDVANRSMLVTGKFQTGLTGERLIADPDGSLNFMPQAGTNGSKMSNVGSDVVWRGPLNTDGRSGRFNVNILGCGMNYSAESEIPNNLRSEVAVFDRRARITAPYIAFEVNGKLSPSDGSERRVQFYETSSSGTALPYSYVSFGISSSSKRGGFYGNGSGWKFEAGNMLVTDDSLNSFGPIKASDFVEQSSITVKRDVIDVDDPAVPLDAQQVFRDVPAVQFNYRDDVPGTPPRLGVIAEQLPAALQRVGPDGKGGISLSISHGTQLGLHHAAIRTIIARLDALEGRPSEV